MAVNERELFLLSRYLTGSLSLRQTRDLEKRLDEDPTLRQALEEIKHTRALLEWLPERKIPRSFTLQPGMSRRPKVPILFPYLRVATALCMLLFIVSIGIGMMPTSMSTDVALMQSAPSAPPQSLSEILPPEAAASKLSTLSDAEQTPESQVLMGANAMPGTSVLETTTAPVVRAPEEEPYTPPQRSTENRQNPWPTLAWISGLLSSILLIAAVLFYRREHL